MASQAYGYRINQSTIKGVLSLVLIPILISWNINNRLVILYLQSTRQTQSNKLIFKGINDITSLWLRSRLHSKQDLKNLLKSIFLILALLNPYNFLTTVHGLYFSQSCALFNYMLMKDLCICWARNYACSEQVLVKKKYSDPLV